MTRWSEAEDAARAADELSRLLDGPELTVTLPVEVWRVMLVEFGVNAENHGPGGVLDAVCLAAGEIRRAQIAGGVPVRVPTCDLCWMLCDPRRGKPHRDATGDNWLCHDCAEECGSVELEEGACAPTT